MTKQEIIKELTQKEIKQIQRSTEEIIENTGFKVLNSKARKIAHEAGAYVDEANEIIRIPPPLLRELLSRVPESYIISGSDGVEWTIGAGNQVSAAIVTDPWIIDYETRKPRKPCLDDVRKHTIIAQKLETVAAIARMDFPVTDYTDATSSLRALEVHLLNHTRHLQVMAASYDSWKEWLDLGDILLGGRDLKNSNLMSVGVAVKSPLSISDLNVKFLFGACENNFPVVPTICPMAGTTSPYSLASTLLLGNTENIFMAALTQIINPGNPFLYTFGPSITEMKRGYDLYYTLDKVLLKLAGVRMAQSYNFPAAAECGGTLTYRYDQQNGMEGMLFMLSAAASDADILAGIGSCYNAVGMSAEMMIVQEEWLRAAQFLRRGLNTDLLVKGLESIRNIGPGGNFLMDSLTIELLRSNEHFSSDIMDFSGGYGESPSLLERAHEKAEEMAANFTSPIPEKRQNELRRYFRKLYEN